MQIKTKNKQAIIVEKKNAINEIEMLVSNRRPIKCQGPSLFSRHLVRLTSLPNVGVLTDNFYSS